MNPVSLSWISFYQWTYWQCLGELQNRIVTQSPTFVVTPNPEMLYEASKDTELLWVLKNADYALPDGAGIFVAYQIRNSLLPTVLKYIALSYWCLRAIIHDASLSADYGERITGSRLTKDLIAYAASHKIPITIIDPIVHWDTGWDRAKKQSQENMQHTLEEKYPWILCRVIVSDTAPETLEKNGIIFATHGNGRQEKLLAEVIKKNPNCGLAIGVGGSIDLITGFRQPAPIFFQRFGGEWLYRLFKNPKKHSQRMKKVITYLLHQLG